MILDVGVGASPGESSASQFNLTHSVAEELDSLLDEVDSEFIVEGFEIGIYSKKHDFDNHLKVGIFEGVDPSDSLAELAEKTALITMNPRESCHRERRLSREWRLEAES